MPITVNYNPDIELLGEMSYQTGAGVAALRERQRQDQLRQLAQQRMDALRAADIQRYDQYNQADIQRQYGAEQAQIAAERQQQQNEIARQQQQQQFEAEQQRLATQGQQEYDLRFASELGLQRSREDEASLREKQRQYYLENIEQKRRQDDAQREQWRKEQEIKYGGTWQLDETTANQKKSELNQLQMYRGQMLPQEYEQAVQQLEDKYRDLEQFVPKQKTFQEEVQELSYTDEQGNIWYKNPADGSIRFEAAPKPQKADTSPTEILSLAYKISEGLKPTDAEKLDMLDRNNSKGLFEQRKANTRNQIIAQLSGESDPQTQPAGTEAPPPAPGPEQTGAPEQGAEEEPKLKVSELTPEQLEEIGQTFSPEQMSQLASLNMSLEQAITSGDYVSQTRIIMQIQALYRQNGYEI